MKLGLLLALSATATLVAAAARADETPYSLPFQLRPAVVANVIRSDSSLAFYKDPQPGGKNGFTLATMLSGSLKVTPQLAPFVRLGWVANSLPSAGTALVNPAVGAAYALELNESMRLAFSLGVTAPIGQGTLTSGAVSPENVATGAGAVARSNFDNPMFAVDYFAVFPGVDFAWISHGFTVQVEATLFQLTRVRGEEVTGNVTNLTSGLHAAYFVVPAFSVGAELRHQRLLSTQKSVEDRPARRDTTTVAIGARAHFKTGESSWLRPGLSLSLPIDAPMTDASYKIVQIDIPFIF